MKTALTFLIVALVSAGAGIAVYATVLAPRLSGEAHREPPADKIPAHAKNIDFGEDMVSIPAPDDQSAAAVLLFSVSLKVSNEEAAKLVEEDKAYFQEMLADLHRYKTAKDLNDPLVKETIKKEALKKANERLERLQMEPKEEIKVLEVAHTKFTVVEQ